MRRGVALVGLALAAAAAVAYGPPWNSPNDQACRNNLKQMAVGLLMYCQDYDDRFPPMANAQQLERRVIPYLRVREVLSCPGTGEPYAPNPALNYVAFTQVKSSAEMLMLRDAKPHQTDPDEARWHFVNADGHADVSATEPRLGALAPDPPRPKPMSKAQLVTLQLQLLRQQRKAIDAMILKLEAEQRKLRSRR